MILQTSVSQCYAACQIYRPDTVTFLSIVSTMYRLEQKFLLPSSEQRVRIMMICLRLKKTHEVVSYRTCMGRSDLHEALYHTAVCLQEHRSKRGCLSFFLSRILFYLPQNL
jgi:hypothetical protein